MIDAISIKNFKSLKDIKLSLTRLNILAGLNGSGKSSLVQSLLLLRESQSKNRCRELVLKLQDMFDFGTSKDLFYHYAGSDETIVFTVEHIGGQVFTREYQYVTGSDLLRCTSKNDQEADSDMSLFKESFQYLNAEHLSANAPAPRSEAHISMGDIGSRGEYAAHFLAEYGISKQVSYEKMLHPSARSRALIHQADAWLGEISPGVKLIAEDNKGLGQVRLAFKFETQNGYTEEIKPINTGFGISYVLPVVVALLKARKGEMLIIENPESHLHPRGQSVLGRMVAYAAAEGVQVLVETHSDHFINGVRVAVKNGMKPSWAKILYFDRTLDQREQFSYVTEITLDKNGELSVYPPGFLDEWNEQLMRLL